MKNIINYVKTNVVFNLNAFIENRGSINLCIFIFFMLIIMNYGGLIYLPLLIMGIVDVFIDKKLSNQKFKCYYFIITFSIIILYFIYGIYDIKQHQS